MNLNRPDMTETVKSENYTKKFLQKDSNPTTMEVVTQTNAVKSLSDGSILVCSRVSARFLHGFCTVSNRAEGAFCCKIRQRVQKLPGEKSRCFD